MVQSGTGLVIYFMVLFEKHGFSISPISVSARRHWFKLITLNLYFYGTHDKGFYTSSKILLVRDAFEIGYVNL